MNTTNQPMDTNNLIKTTYPYAASPTTARNQCAECGGWQRDDAADKGRLVGEIVHSKRCDSKPQIETVNAALAKRAEDDAARRLQRLVYSYRRSAIWGGSEQEMADAVRLGLLTGSDAMNRDG